MPTIKRSTAAGTTGRDEQRPPVKSAAMSRTAAAKAVKTEAVKTAPKFVLATEFTEPVSSIEDLTWFIYGEPKIGKTSLASMFPNAIFMSFEPGGKGLRIKRNDVKSWAEFKLYVPQIIKSSYRTVVIDTIDVAYDLCFNHVCTDLGIDHPTDLGYGKGWNAIAKEFSLQMDRLLKSGKGVIFISHAEDKAFQKRTGGEYNKLVPSVAKSARNYARAAADVLAYYGYYGDERYLTICGNDEIDSGHRLDCQFWVFKAGRTQEEIVRVLTSSLDYDTEGNPLVEGWERVHSVPMGSTAQEAYRNVLRAFNNEQTDRCEPDDIAVLSDVPAKMKSKK